MKTIDKIKNHPLYKSIDHEGPDGYWLYLTGDYNDNDPLNPSDLIHEDTIDACWQQLKSLKRPRGDLARGETQTRKDSMENLTQQEHEIIDTLEPWDSIDAYPMRKWQKRITPSVPVEVKKSTFGCVNCLWNSCECKSGSKYEPSIAGKNIPSCKSYTYYD